MDVVLWAFLVWVFVSPPHPPPPICLNVCCLSRWRRYPSMCSKLVGGSSERKRSSGPQRSESAEAFVTALPKALCPSSTIRSCSPPASNSESHTDIGVCGLLCFAQGLPLSSCSWFYLRLNTTVEGRLSTFQTPGQRCQDLTFCRASWIHGGVCASHSPLLGFQITQVKVTGHSPSHRAGAVRGYLLQTCSLWAWRWPHRVRLSLWTMVLTESNPACYIF